MMHDVVIDLDIRRIQLVSSLREIPKSAGCRFGSES
jgi:hypothetical protein